MPELISFAGGSPFSPTKCSGVPSRTLAVRTMRLRGKDPPEVRMGHIPVSNLSWARAPFPLTVSPMRANANPSCAILPTKSSLGVEKAKSGPANETHTKKKTGMPCNFCVEASLELHLYPSIVRECGSALGFCSLEPLLQDPHLLQATLRIPHGLTPSLARVALQAELHRASPVSSRRPSGSSPHGAPTGAFAGHRSEIQHCAQTPRPNTLIIPQTE